MMIPALRHLPLVVAPVVLLSLGGCATTGAAGSGAVGTIKATPKRDASAAVQRALTAGGHSCQIQSSGNVICDAQAKDVPTIVTVFEDTPAGLQIGFATAFPWKAPNPCTEMSVKFNQLNSSSDFIHAICQEGNVTFVASVLVPELGFTDKEINGYATWFVGSMPALLRESGALPLLKEE